MMSRDAKLYYLRRRRVRRPWFLVRVSGDTRTDLSYGPSLASLLKRRSAFGNRHELHAERRG